MRLSIGIVALFLFALCALPAEADWCIDPSKKLIFEPAFGFDVQGPVMGMTNQVNSPTMGYGLGFSLFSFDEGRIRLLDVSVGVGIRRWDLWRDRQYINIAPIAIRIFGDAKAGLYFKPSYTWSNYPPEYDHHNVSFQFAYRIGTRQHGR